MRFTVFTPTYNREATIGRVYESLLKQTLRDFEWLIVDDGSTDGTPELVEGWIKDPKVEFSIRYVWQENAHKKAAHNRAISMAAGELMVVLDSDDWCVPHALECFWEHWIEIPEVERKEFMGVCGLCMNEKGAIVGDQYPTDQYLDSNSQELKYLYHVTGEKWGAMKTELLKDFPFRDDLPGIVPESTVWDAIAVHYRTRFFNEPLRIYTQDVPGIIARKGERPDAKKGAPGAAYAKKFVLDNNIAYLSYAPRQFVFEAARLTRFWLHCPKEFKKKIGYWPKSRAGRAIVVVGSPLGLGMYFVDLWRMSRNGIAK